MPYLSSTRRAFPKTISTRFLFDHFLNVLIDFCFVSDSVMAAEVEMIENNECDYPFPFLPLAEFAMARLFNILVPDAILNRLKLSFVSKVHQ